MKSYTILVTYKKVPGWFMYLSIMADDPDGALHSAYKLSGYDRDNYIFSIENVKKTNRSK